MLDWFTNLFRPKPHVCPNCDVLKELLMEERLEKQRYVERFMNTYLPIKSETTTPNNNLGDITIRRRRLHPLEGIIRRDLENAKRNRERSEGESSSEIQE